MGAENPFGGFDKYFLYAEAAPALLTSLPICLGFLTLAAKDAPVLGTVVGVATSCCVAIPMAQAVRRIGRRAENRIFIKKDGFPTTRFLRHSDGRLPTATLSRYHTKLGQLVPDVVLPNKADEERDPIAADEIYSSCIDKMRELTRDPTKFSLVLQNNCEFGFRRNCRAIRLTGILSSLSGLFLAGWWWFHHGKSQPYILDIATLASSALLLLWWTFYVNDVYVCEAADEYAIRLLATCDSIEPPATAASQPQPPQSVLILSHEVQEGRTKRT